MVASLQHKNGQEQDETLLMNQPIQAISCDLWETLIKPNKKYGPKRYSVIRDFIRRKTLVNYSLDEVYEKVRHFKKVVEAYMEKTGKQLNVTDIYKTMLAILEFRDAQEDDVIELKAELSNLIREYPPVLIDGVAETLFELADLNLDLVLCSNTVLISGGTLRRTFEENGMSLLKCFKGNLVFSDSGDYCKPHPKMFETAFSQVKADSYSNILHVGDNVATDGACIKVGAQFLLVNHRDALHDIKDLTNYLKSIRCKPLSLTQ